VEKVFAVVIGADRISNQADIDCMKKAGLLTGVTSVLDLQINMGSKRQVEASASNIAFDSQYRKMAVGEFARKGVDAELAALRVSKLETPDGALFIIVTR
jgi:hypothetical protein